MTKKDKKIFQEYISRFIRICKYNRAMHRAFWKWLDDEYRAGRYKINEDELGEKDVN
jgi:hypothetical protein